MKAKFKPDGVTSVTPHLVCAGAASAIEFYKNAFGAQEVLRMPGPGGGIMHAQLRIGDANIFLVDENPQYGSLGPKAIGGSPVTIHLYVPDVDASVAQAVKAGARCTMPAQDMFWGDRYGRVEDPYGHHWAMATHLRDMSAEEIQAAMRAMSPSRGQS